VAVVGVDDLITVFVGGSESVSEREKLSEEIRSYLSEKTGLNSRAFEVRTIDAIPVKDSGKIDYQQLQGMVE